MPTSTGLRGGCRDSPTGNREWRDVGLRARVTAGCSGKPRPPSSSRDRLRSERSASAPSEENRSVPTAGRRTRPDDSELVGHRSQSADDGRRRPPAAWLLRWLGGAFCRYRRAIPRAARAFSHGGGTLSDIDRQRRRTSSHRPMARGLPTVDPRGPARPRSPSPRGRSGDRGRGSTSRRCVARRGSIGGSPERFACHAEPAGVNRRRKHPSARAIAVHRNSRARRASSRRATSRPAIRRRCSSEGESACRPPPGPSRDATSLGGSN